MKADVRSRKGIWLLQTSFLVDAMGRSHPDYHLRSVTGSAGSTPASPNNY